MKLILFGATGMVGSAVLEQCLNDHRVERVLVVGRRSCEVDDPRVEEIVTDDLFDYGVHAEQLVGLDACFFCLGVSSAGMGEAAYRRVTYDLTLAAARALLKASPQMTFCYLSGAGADSSEKGRVMWARVRGKTENDVLGVGFRAAYIFRPAYIHPVSGLGSRTRLYRFFYAVAGPLYPLIRRLFPRLVTTTERFAKAMIAVAAEGYERQILESDDINRAAEGRSRTAASGLPDAA